MLIQRTELFDEKIPGLILVSHGNLATALLQTLCMINIQASNISAFGLEFGDDPDEFREVLVEERKRYSRGSLFLVDIFGGSPFNQLVYASHIYKDIRCIYGVNLMMLLELSLLRVDKSVEELVKYVEGNKVKFIGNLSI